MTLLTLSSFGQPLISKTGHVYLYWFAGGIEDSQQLFDWYSFSHFIHGIIFFFFISFLGNLFFKNGKNIQINLLIAVCIESAWELLENSPIIIERYRQTALAAGYFGDSVLNSASDLTTMILGFIFAYKFGWKISLALVICLELLTLFFIRDNLFLNVVMLIYPIGFINAWQVGV